MSPDSYAVQQAMLLLSRGEPLPIYLMAALADEGILIDEFIEAHSE